jgi:CYTH domain-containing protein
VAAGREIERKFLVSALPPDLDRHPASEIRQGYLAIEPGGSEVRLRSRDGRSLMTVKRGTGRTRVEVEVPIDADAFERLWPLTEGRRVEKVRHLLPADGGLVLELDVYSGDLAGLVVAEVEFAGEAQADAYVPPAWLGADVTADERFKNHNLAVDGMPEGLPAA